MNKDIEDLFADNGGKLSIWKKDAKEAIYLHLLKDHFEIELTGSDRSPALASP